MKPLGHYGKRKTGALTSVFSIILVLLYVAGTVEIDSIHSFIHEEENPTLHSRSNEKDPCHLAIYHNVKGCHHKSHLFESDKCPLCQISLHNTQFGSRRFVLDKVFQAGVAPVATPEYYAGISLPESSSRAPPVG